MRILKLSIFLILLAFVSCNNSTEVDINTLEIEEDENERSGDDLSIYTIPTPVLISNIMQLYKIDYNPEILESNISVEREQFSSLAMALNLGINLVDLSYSSTFEQTQYSIKYLNYIDKLLSEMNIRNYETMFAFDRFRQNISDNDSLSAMLIEFQEKLNGYYSTEKSDDISLFIIGGIYIEGLYISLNYHDKVIGNDFNKNFASAAGYKNLILQQKAYLENIDELLSEYKKEDNNRLLGYYDELKAQFEKLDIQYTTNEKTNKIENITYNRAEMQNLKNITDTIRTYIMRM